MHVYVFFLNVMTHVFHILVTNLAQNKCVFFTSALFSQVCYLERVLCSCISRAWNETNVYSRSQRKRGHKGSARSAIERTRSLSTRRCERTHRYRREADVSHGTTPSLPCIWGRVKVVSITIGIGEIRPSFRRKLPAAALSPARGISGAMDRDVSRDLRIRSSPRPAKEPPLRLRLA